MKHPFSRAQPPCLPLLLWDTPPGLELILAQEGVAHLAVRDPHPLAFGGGRFVLFDSRRVASKLVRATLGAQHVALDVDVLRRELGTDPFEALIDHRAAPATWRISGLELTERVARFPKAALRRRILNRLRDVVIRAGGIWARLGTFPFPYRSAFNFRADLDEPYPDDYARFARARRPLQDCVTHFVSTHAYGEMPAVLDDLRDFDTQSHAHFHVVYRHEAANRRNVERAHQILLQHGFDLAGFAAPEGRWTAGLDRALEDLGYIYSSDFQLGYDDVPFFPWREGRFSRVLQVPVHPICEGLFLDAGATEGRIIAEHLIATVRAKLAAGEPAFVYGHPERRLGRFPEVVSALATALEGEDLLWRTTLTEFAVWWHWRSQRRWSLVAKENGRHEIQFDDWDSDYPLTLEVQRGSHVATIPLIGPRTPLRLGDLVFARKRGRSDLSNPTTALPRPSLKAAVKHALDWETVTPCCELPGDTLTARLKRGLRRVRSGMGGAA